MINNHNGDAHCSASFSPWLRSFHETIKKIKEITQQKCGVCEISFTSLPQSKLKDRDKWSQFSLQPFNFCHSLVEEKKKTETHLIALYQNKPGGPNSSMSQAWQLCGFLPSPPHLFYASLSCSPLLFSPDNPSLSSCGLTPISISHCHTLHHSSLLYSLPTLLPPLSEALETRHWLLYTMAPVFT